MACMYGSPGVTRRQPSWNVGVNPDDYELEVTFARGRLFTFKQSFVFDQPSHPVPEDLLELFLSLRLSVERRKESIEVVLNALAVCYQFTCFSKFFLVITRICFASALKSNCGLFNQTYKVYCHQPPSPALRTRLQSAQKRPYV